MKVSNEVLLLETVSQQVYKAVGKPKDYFEVAAVLESMGYTDRQVKDVSGYKDVFELSEKILDLLSCEKEKTYYGQNDQYSGYKIRNIIIDIIRGMLSVCPLLISMFSVFIINFSLWSFMDNSVTGLEKATAIAFATIMSMIVSGGFAQVFLRKGYAFCEQRRYKLMWKAYIQYLKMGIVTAFFLGVLLSGLAMFSGVYKLQNIFIFAAYLILLTAIWLNIPVTSLLKAEIFFVINMLLSMGLVYILHHILYLNIDFSQMLAMSFFIVFHSLFLRTVLYFLSKSREANQRETTYKPRLLISMFLLIPYFLYGLLYYTLVFMDRIIAWSANARVIIEPVMRIKGEYELGMNWGVLVVLIPILFIEPYVKMFINTIYRAKKEYKVIEQKKFIRKNMIRVLTYMAIFWATALIGALISIMVINSAVSWFDIKLSPYFSGISEIVFVLAIIGYLFIVAGLLNNIYLLYFSQGELIIKALAVSIAVNLVVGFTLSRMFDYYYAVVGFLTGAVTFFAASMYYTYKVLNSVDYYFYKGT